MTVIVARARSRLRPINGDRLVELRQERGWTLVALAARSGVSRQYLGELERGDKHGIRNPGIAVALARAFDVDLNEILLPAAPAQ